MTAALLLAVNLALPAAAAAAEPSPAFVESVVATADGVAIMSSEYQKELDSSLAYLRRTNPSALKKPDLMRKIRESTLEELITRRLLIREGEREGLTVGERDLDDAVQEIKDRFKEDAETGATLDDAAAERAFQAKLKADGEDFGEFRQALSGDIMARKVIARNVTEKVPPPDDAAIRDFYDRIVAYNASKSTSAPAGMSADDAELLREAAFQVKALSSEGVRVSRILIRVAQPPDENEFRRKKKAAQDIKKRLDAGEDFAKVAREESEDPQSAARGGDLGFIVRGISEPGLEKAAFSLTVGQTSEPRLIEAGYNILRATEKRTARAPTFERFKEDLKSYLDGVAQKKKLQSYLLELRSKAVIERHLPPS
jgi:parvulin-like peptidyl-prolyl isomerase